MKYLILILNIAFSQLYLELLATDFDKPVYVISNPANPSILYVVEQEGYIWTIKDGNEIDKPFLDITDIVHKPLFPGDEMGLLGFVFAQGYDTNGFIYVNYNDKDDNTIISRFTSINNNNIDNSTESIMMKFKQPYSNNNGGHMAFGPDNFVYISIGDGGSSGDPYNMAQDLTNIF